MIRYSLICDRAHGFQSWFADSAAFETQAKRGLVACPDCGSIKIGKAIMAPSVARKDRTTAAGGVVETGAEPSAAVPPAGPRKGALIDEKQRTMAGILREIHAKIIENTDDVGKSFPDEARRMHDGEIPARAIRGEATAEEARDLLDEGIQIMAVPRPPDAWN